MSFNTDEDIFLEIIMVDFFYVKKTRIGNRCNCNECLIDKISMVNSWSLDVFFTDYHHNVIRVSRGLN